MPEIKGNISRRERRAKIRLPKHLAQADVRSSTSGTEKLYELYAFARAHFSNGEFAEAERSCRAILAREPDDIPALVLLADTVRQGDRNKLAVKLLERALALDCENPAAHDSIAMAYQALGGEDEAIQHFMLAFALGLADAEALVKRRAAVAAPLRRLAAAWPRQPGLAGLLGPQFATALAQEAALLALLQARVVHDPDLERLLTIIRRGLLEHVATGAELSEYGDSLAFFCALAQQCFINDYVYAVRHTERVQLQHVQSRVASALAAGRDIVAFDLITAASYLPLHQLPMASSLLNRLWPDAISRLLTQQIAEPLEEASDRDSIPVLSCVDDSVSLQVQRQYEESPYPRWSAVPPIKPTTVVKFLRDQLGISPTAWPITTVGVEILIAGCGTGSHSIDSALRFPSARLLAIDISRTSLAFARRKTRSLGLTNVEYAQADILELPALGRRFDVIETVGVLHHLADPMAGWRALLSLLRPNGLMFVGLYSALARQSLAAARTFIAERGYRPTPDDIRTCRQELIRTGWVPQYRDFSSTSGCRDLLFNVMEHRFDIPEIRTFIETHGLQFLGFEQLPAGALDQFRQCYSDEASTRDLAAWHSFEQDHPQTFANMYLFWVQKAQSH
jgi:2-polyprenyl-3-methyl-5-hydroxy-6-metoxy-1,4-benzoquinol methylase